MPAFKVWSSCRSVKRFVVAATLAEVIANGAAKLGLSEATGCTLVLEEDGTVIDADEILLECVSKPLIILRQNETWKPAGEDVATLANVNQHVGVIQQAATPSPLREQTSYPTTTQLPTLPGSPIAERIALITREILAAPPPPYSALVIQHIQGQDAVPERIWSTLIAETAAYYLGKWPDLNDQQHYRAIGQLVYTKYPAIGLSGANPWVSIDCIHKKAGLIQCCASAAAFFFKLQDKPTSTHEGMVTPIVNMIRVDFGKLDITSIVHMIRSQNSRTSQSAFNKSLSQKIRHTRLSIRTRSRVLENPTAIPCKRPRQSFNALLPTSAAPVEVTSEEAVDRHVAEIVKEWDKPANSRSTSHLFALLKATRNDRQQMLSSSTVGCMSLVFQKYPMLQDYKFVLKEFVLVFGSEKFRQMSANITRFMWAVETLNGIVVEANKMKDPFRMLAVIDIAEKATRWHQGKGSSKTMPLVKIKADVVDGDVSGQLVTSAQEGPSIVVFTDAARSKFEAIFVVGDTVHCEVEKKYGLHGALLTLISLYYIFDLQYPRPYSMILTLLQTVVMKDLSKAETSKGYKTFLKSLTAAMETVPDPPSEQQPSVE